MLKENLEQDEFPSNFLSGVGFTLLILGTGWGWVIGIGDLFSDRIYTGWRFIIALALFAFGLAALLVRDQFPRPLPHNPILRELSDLTAKATVVSATLAIILFIAALIARGYAVWQGRSLILCVWTAPIASFLTAIAALFLSFELWPELPELDVHC